MTPEEHDLLRRRVTEAQRLGRDVFEHLNRWGHLLTGQVIKRIRARTFDEAADRIEGASITNIITWYGSNGNTALDAQRGIVNLLRKMAAEEKK